MGKSNTILISHHFKPRHCNNKTGEIIENPRGIIYCSNFHNDLSVFNILKKIPFTDKILHFLLVGTAALLLNKVLQFKTFRLLRLHVYWGSEIVGIAAIIEEISQIYIPSRTFDLMDLAFDFFGVLSISRFYIKILHSGFSSPN